jgi:predicted regulator of Ras-like GTPase activity (Roadblock/LC7/MglB family)
MIRGDLDQVVAALRDPLRIFKRETRVRLVILLDRSGQVLAEEGFTGSYEISSVASLAAAANSASQALAGLAATDSWTHLHHAGRERELFLAPFQTPSAELILVAIYDRDSSLGMVQLFFDKFIETVSALPQLAVRGPAGSAETFERDLEAGLRTIAPPEWLG